MSSQQEGIGKLKLCNGLLDVIGREWVVFLALFHELINPILYPCCSHVSSSFLSLIAGMIFIECDGFDVWHFSLLVKLISTMQVAGLDSSYRLGLEPMRAHFATSSAQLR